MKVNAASDEALPSDPVIKSYLEATESWWAMTSTVVR